MLPERRYRYGKKEYYEEKLRNGHVQWPDPRKTIAYAVVDPVNRIEQVAYRLIMIKSINDQGDIFTHITGDVVIFCKKLRRLIDQVC